MSASSGVAAAIDIGSTSVKLLIGGRAGPIVRHEVVTNLGRGVDANGRFDPPTVEATMEAMRGFASVLAAHGEPPRRVVATSASRRAADRDSLFARVGQIVGVGPELLSGTDEGRLSYTGALHALPPGHSLRGPVTVVDIGGGSTELIIDAGNGPVVRSLPVGAGRLSEQELRDDPPLPEQLSNAIGLVNDRLEDAFMEIPALSHTVTLVGVGGTIRVAAAVEVGIDPSEALNGFHFSRAAAEDVFRTLATEPLADRLFNPGLPAARGEVIVGGCCVLVAVLRRLRSAQLVVSTGGLLDGVVAEQLGELR